MKSSGFLLLPLVTLAMFLPGCTTTSDPVTTPVGTVWVTFTKASTGSLLDDKINTLNSDQSGRVWIGTDSGANYFLRGSWGRIRDSLRYSPDGVQSRYRVNAIQWGKGATIWFGMDGGGVKRFREGASRAVWTTYTVPVITYYNVQSISADRVVNGDVWVATTFGISRFIPSASDPEFGTWTTYTSPNIPSNQVYASAIHLTDNTVWFGTQDGFAMYNDEINDWTTFSIPTQYNYKINSMVFDLGGTLWMAKLEGVTSFNKVSGVWNHYTNENTGGRLPPGEIHAVTTDLGSVRWFGTDHGLVRLSDTTWTTFTMSTTPELPDNSVTALVYDSRGNLWIGTKKGIAVFNEHGTSF